MRHLHGANSRYKSRVYQAGRETETFWTLGHRIASAATQGVYQNGQDNVASSTIHDFKLFPSQKQIDLDHNIWKYLLIVFNKKWIGKFIVSVYCIYI